VALDITRMLAKRPGDLAGTDIPAHVMDAFEGSKLRDIHLFGRRGPAAVKFSPLELRELGRVPGVTMILDDRDFDFTPWDLEALRGDGRLRQAVKTLETWRASPQGDGERRIHFHFYWRPERIEGDSEVTGVTMRRTEPDGAGGVRDTPETRTFPAQAVYRAVGYFGSPVAGAPFDDAAGVIPNAGGRVLGADGRPAPGLYATGWIKRGPVGLIGSTKSDALETVGHIVEDLPALPGAPERSTDSFVEALRRRGVEVVTWEGWKAIDAAEMARGAAEGRDRAKFATGADMIRAANESI
jgi:ferredoxin--NADP+ reductase